jgi:hypothetical protein
MHSFKSLRLLNENGFIYDDFNLHEQDIAKPAKNKRNTFTAMKEILILEMKQSFMVSNPNQEKGLRRRF